MEVSILLPCPVWTLSVSLHEAPYGAPYEAAYGAQYETPYGAPFAAPCGAPYGAPYGLTNGQRNIIETPTYMCYIIYTVVTH